MSKFIQQKIDNFKKIINNKHPYLTGREIAAINILSNYFDEKKFKELFINTVCSKFIYLLSCVDRGVVKQALIVSNYIEYSDSHEQKCEFTDSMALCSRIFGCGVTISGNLIDRIYFIYNPKLVSCTQISELIAWKCYIDINIAYRPKEYQIACDAYDRVVGKEHLIEKKFSSSKSIIIKELKSIIIEELKIIEEEELKIIEEEKNCTKMIESIESIITE